MYSFVFESFAKVLVTMVGLWRLGVAAATWAQFPMAVDARNEGEGPYIFLAMALALISKVGSLIRHQIKPTVLLF